MDGFFVVVVFCFALFLLVNVVVFKAFLRLKNMKVQYSNSAGL